MRPPILLLLLFILGCAPDRPAPERAFYHWETRLDLSREEVDYLRKLGVTVLYARFFDVDWEEELLDAVPLAEVQIDTVGLAGLRVVPAVFITNRTMEQLPATGIPLLAERIMDKLEYLSRALPGGGFDEIHIDCDWTGGTRAAYFSLLEALGARCREKNRRLTVTIRLHQWKYADRTGVPPADAGILMCYNTGQLESWEEPNSILSEAAVKPYLKSLEPYPLPLGLALPVFRWGVVFRDEVLVRLMHGLDAKALSDTARFRQIGPDRFQVEKSTYLQGHYLYRGDRIRLESTDARTLNQVLGLLRPALRKLPPYTLAMYHLEPTLLQRMPYEVMDPIFRKVGR